MTTGKPRRSRKPRAKPGSGHADIDVPANDGFAPEAAPASAAEAAEQASLGRQDASAAAEQILGANPLIGIDKGEILDAARRALRLIALRPQMLLEENMTFGREVIDVLLGRSTIEPPDPKDRRFSHEIWRKSGYYKRLMQGFFAWRNMLNRVLDRADATEADRERARFALSLLTEALAPTNSLLGNPGALQRAIETRGRSLLFGARNMLDDLLNNGGMPKTVDERKFQVGKNLALTPGAVVFRDEVFELIQYKSATASVQTRPLLVIPPQINKFYMLDLAPGRSFAQFATQQGVQLFCISWRNPTAAHRDWNLETYLSAAKQAIKVTREITAADQVNVMAACAGGFTLAVLLGHLAAIGDQSVASATLLVTVLDTGAPTLLGQFASRTAIAGAIKKSQQEGVLEGAEMSRIFSWLRPNDLVWMFVANNWVMGNRPPAFDILYWNSDTTRLPAEFHADLLKLFLENPLKHAGQHEALGTAIDMKKVKVPFYIVAGITDHITPWEACYETRHIVKSPITFVLSSSGHIQSIVNPPDNPKAKFFVNPDLKLDAQHWLKTATPMSGSWWSHWHQWLSKHAGPETAPPDALGNADYPPGDAAPGRYVHQR